MLMNACEIQNACLDESILSDVVKELDESGTRVATEQALARHTKFLISRSNDRGTITVTLSETYSEAPRKGPSPCIYCMSFLLFMLVNYNTNAY